MNRFDLNTLSKCGAKTRSGNPCKRLGNKRNGRCKLHGGKSTGAKSKDGKLVVSKNAITNYGSWLFNRNIKPETEHAVDYVVEKLMELDSSTLGSKLIDEQLIKLFDEYRIDVEALKYGALNKFGEEIFILVQSALDRYYKIAGGAHMRFHTIAPMVNAPHFCKDETAQQTEYNINLLVKISSRPLPDVF